MNLDINLGQALTVITILGGLVALLFKIGRQFEAMLVVQKTNIVRLDGHDDDFDAVKKIVAELAQMMAVHVRDHAQYDRKLDNICERLRAIEQRHPPK